MPARSQVLASNLACLTNGKRERPRSRVLTADRTLQVLVADLVAARRAACMTQEEVAGRMWRRKASSRTLVEIRVRTRR